MFQGLKCKTALPSLQIRNSGVLRENQPLQPTWSMQDYWRASQIDHRPFKGNNVGVAMEYWTSSTPWLGSQRMDGTFPNLFRCALWTCHNVIILFITFIDRMSRRSRGVEGSGLVASGFHPCFFQIAWSCWLH